jgi:hypothetical protein
MPYKAPFHPNFDEKALLERARGYAKILEYDDSKILEVHCITLAPNILGKTIYSEDGDGAIILINRSYKFEDAFEFNANIIHEICHVYTNSDLEWHMAMVRAANTIVTFNYDLLRDEATDHPLD